MPRYSIEYIKKKLLRASKRKTRRGAINDLIDLVFHPWFGDTAGLAEILDFLAHSINEGGLNLGKFEKYNLYSFIHSILKVIQEREGRRK